jgi:hypothetical protein
MHHILPLVVIVVLVPLTTTTLDILMPGHRSVIHELLLEVPDSLAGWQFIAAPTAGFGVLQIEPGKPFRFSAKYGTRIHALPATAQVPERFDGPWPEGTRTCAVPVTEVNSVPLTHPLARVLTTCRAHASEPNHLRIEVVAEERWDAGGRRLEAGVLITTMWAVALIGLIGLASLGVVNRQRRRTLVAEPA